MKVFNKALIAVSLMSALAGCQPAPEETASSSLPTAQDAADFVESAQQEMEKIGVPAAKAAWIYATNINQDTAAVNAYMSEIYANRAAELAKQAAD